MRQNDPRLRVTKNQFKLTIITSVLTFVTLGIIIFENAKKVKHTYSYLMLGIVFMLMGINQMIYYRNNKMARFLFFSFVYFIAGIAIIGFFIFERLF